MFTRWKGNRGTGQNFFNSFMHVWQLLLQEEGRFTTSRNAEPCEYRAVKPSVRSAARLEAGNSAFQSPGTPSATRFGKGGPPPLEAVGHGTGSLGKWDSVWGGREASSVARVLVLGTSHRSGLDGDQPLSH